MSGSNHNTTLGNNDTESNFNTVEIQEADIQENNKNSKKHKKGRKSIKKNTKNLIIGEEIDINNVKRKEREHDDVNGPMKPLKRKGKERAIEVIDEDEEMVQAPTAAHGLSFILNNNNGNQNTLGKNMNTSGAPKKKVVRKKRPLNTIAVNPPNVLQMLNQSSVGGVSLLQYLAKDRDAARQLSQDLAALHRKKELNDGRKVIINELRNGGLLDENELSDEDYDEETEEESFAELSDYSSDTSSYIDDRDRDSDTIIEYPFDINAILKGKPVRALITINDIVINATIDSGAGASVISQALVNKLKLKKTKVNKRFALTGFNNAVSESNQVVIDAEVRIGEKLRKEHFCVAESITDRDICLLGRTWLKKHNITVAIGQNSLIVPVGENLNSFIEVKCVVDESDSDYEDDEIDSETPIYAVYITRTDGVEINNQDNDLSVMQVNALENDTGYKNANETTLNLNLYHEDITSLRSGTSSSKQENKIPVLRDGQIEVPKIIQDVIDENILVFYEHAGLGRVKGVLHEIVTTTEEPIRTRPYRLTRDEEESLEEELKTLLDLGIIEPSNGKYTSPVFFVPKKDGKLRLVVNFQKLNDITVRDGYPLPHIDDILDSLGGSSCFTVLDAAFGFWQIPLHPNSIEKTGFCTKKGTYQFLMLPMGLSGSPSTYQRTMNNILKDYLGEFVYVFVDDYIVYSKDVETHAKHLKLVFEACMNANLKLKKANTSAKKCMQKLKISSCFLMIFQL